MNITQDKNMVEHRFQSKYLNLRDIAPLLLWKTGFVLDSKHPSTRV